MKVSLHYSQLADGILQCELCPHQCIVKEGQRGRCEVRENRQGKLISLNYNLLGAINIDPIEKKPLYHFQPGGKILSVGTFGCNFNCSFCQNWTLSKGEQGKWTIKPQELIELAVQYAKQRGNMGIAFTYNEPLVWYEYVLEASTLAKKRGLKVVLITNGFINKRPLSILLKHVDAVNIDLKAFNNNYYTQQCGGDLQKVLANIELAKAHCHVEITTLIVTDLNDSIAEINSMAQWLARIDSNIPLHLSRYFPNYHLTNQPTPLNKMMTAREVAAKYLPYVYLGNIPQEVHANNTYCPQCKFQLIIRTDHDIHLTGLNLTDNQHVTCNNCNFHIPVIIS